MKRILNATMCVAVGLSSVMFTQPVAHADNWSQSRVIKRDAVTRFNPTKIVWICKGNERYWVLLELQKNGDWVKIAEGPHRYTIACIRPA